MSLCLLLDSIYSDYSNFFPLSIIITNHCINNDQHNAMKREACTWYPPSHLEPAKILCSRCELCTNERTYASACESRVAYTHLACYVHVYLLYQL